MTKQVVTRQHVNQKALAVAALAMVVAIALAPTDKAREQADTVSTADSSRSLAAR